MGRTALYRDPVPYRPARAEVQLELDALLLVMPDGWVRRHPLDGVTATVSDGFVAERIARGSSDSIVRIDVGRGHTHEAVTTTPRVLRRFVRMLALDRADGERVVVITPPDQGTVAPGVVSVPEAPSDAAIVDPLAWESLTDWLFGGGRLAACSITDLARLACIATPQFAFLIGEVAAQRALEYVWTASGPLRGGFDRSGDLDSVLQPLVDAAKRSPRAGEALVSALSHAAGARRRRHLSR